MDEERQHARLQGHEEREQGIAAAGERVAHHRGHEDDDRRREERHADTAELRSSTLNHWLSRA